VIARVPDRSLRAVGAARDAYVRNGSFGVVVHVREASLVVDFERWGPIEVPISYLEQTLRSGVVGGLAHAYALTTHAAQGETFAVATTLVTDASSTEGVYVGITRGQFELRAVVIRQREIAPSITDDDLPVLREETTTLAAMERRLERNTPERLANEFLRVKRPSDSVGAEPSGDFLHDSPDSLRYVRCNDVDLVELYRAVERDLSQARADISRLEADLNRRQAITESVSNAGFARSGLVDMTTQVHGRLETLSAGIDESMQTLRDMSDELERRGVTLEQVQRADQSLSMPNVEELHAAQASLVVVNHLGVVTTGGYDSAFLGGP